MKQQYFLFLFGPIIMILLGSCEKTEKKPVIIDGKAELLSFGTCKDVKSYYATDSVQDNQSCIEFSFADSVLSLTHVNAGFNCCPGEITADFVFDGNTITITEHESLAECNCDCLYDLEMQVGNLLLGSYHLIFIEPYAMLPGQEIEFTINLNDSLSGSYCVPRDFYPWGIF